MIDHQPGTVPSPPLDARHLLAMSQGQLDELFKRSEPGPVPDGPGTGTAILFPGGLCAGLVARLIAGFARLFLWQGKVFSVPDGVRGTLVNRISLLSVKAIKAEVYRDTSWLDQKPCILLDYSRTSFVAQKIRDEIRQVAPGLYLGKVYWGRTRLCDFCVDFHNRACRGPWSFVARYAVAVLTVLALLLALRFTRDEPVIYANAEDHFKYGSTGGERLSGIPLAIWQILPELFAEKLPGGRYDPQQPYAAFGLIYETGKELPIGVSKRNVQGIDRVFFNCAACHVGTVRDAPGAVPKVVLGMPANSFDIEAFQDFLFACVSDEKFTAQRLMDEIEHRGGGGLDLINRPLLRYYGVGIMRDRLLALRQRFVFTQREPRFGPGRVDTFNPPKALLNFPLDKIPEAEWVGNCDFPSIWLQAKRRGMQLHWDGNNTSLEERNKSAAFGTGAFPPTIDLESLKRTEDWLLDREPPAYPYPIDQGLAAKGAPIYREYCAACHGASGRDFSGALVGKLTPIEQIGTDRHRLDSYSYELSTAQNSLYAGYPWRFSHFRKTFGYANQPLDGIWLRAPYLHNGSVPTLRDLLEPATQRPVTFPRGNDVYDRKRLGFSIDPAGDGVHRLFLFDTRLPGNGNAGHEGKEYGTELAPADKDALVEFLKTF